MTLAQYDAWLAANKNATEKVILPPAGIAL